MKKFLLSVLLVFGLITTVDAQIYVGGSFGFNYTKEENICYDMMITPEVGYCITDNHVVSLAVGYGGEYSKTSEEDYYGQLFYVAPCYTYCINFGDKWCFDINTTIGYTRYFYDSKNTIGLYLGPQLEYALTDNWTIWGAFDLFGLENTWIDNSDKIESTSLNIDWFSNGLGFGFYYYF